MEEGLLTKLPAPTQELLSQSDINNSYEVYLLKYNLKQELDKQLEKYISVLNHDIKTPVLAQIRALEHLLTGSKGEFAPVQKDLLVMTLESCHEQYDIINNLINTLKYKKQGISLTCTNFDLVEMLKANLRRLKKAIKENDNHIKFSVTQPEIVINADEEKLSEAIYKLLKHVLTNIGHGTTIKIEAAESEEGQNAIISICGVMTGNGCGFTYSGSRQFYINQESYSSVGSSIEVRLAEDIISAHNGKLNQSWIDNSQLWGITLPKKHIEY